MAAIALALSAPAAASFTYVPPPDPPLYQVAPDGPPGSLASLLTGLLDDGTEVVWADGTDPGQAAPAGETDWRAALTGAGLAWAREGDVLLVFPNDAAPWDITPSPPRTWFVAPGELLADVLARWGEDAGVEIVWLTDRRWRIDQRATFSGAFEDAARALLFSLSHLSHAPVAQFAPSGRTLVIVHRPPPATENDP
ncbi:MAG: TcpQ domain-containing protein [Rhodospirillaceae bacterium]|nr:TcpQ domain-containing protein [Rhodospirillaceae bacterium]